MLHKNVNEYFRIISRKSSNISTTLIRQNTLYENVKYYNNNLGQELSNKSIIDKEQEIKDAISTSKCNTPYLKTTAEFVADVKLLSLLDENKFKSVILLLTKCQINCFDSHLNIDIFQNNSFQK